MANSYLKPKLRGRSENFVSIRGRQSARSPSATGFDQLEGANPSGCRCIVDTHRDDGKRFVAHADEKLSFWN
ncbi:MAG: hypothetical protein DME98_15500 [Verrucomicrobia bacterium]|nr:MAG: hypothetical protein DME98_15500 [Verrucomicrobiota bacterium]PYJ33558.1 MAG: hypothetical protein DME88_08010 [Verrucomicrobiota bacterium]